QGTALGSAPSSRTVRSSHSAPGALPAEVVTCGSVPITASSSLVWLRMSPYRLGVSQPAHSEPVQGCASNNALVRSNMQGCISEQANRGEYWNARQTTDAYCPAPPTGGGTTIVARVVWVNARRGCRAHRDQRGDDVPHRSEEH